MLLEFLQAVTGVFVLVYDGQHALKFTLGRARKVVPPGIHWKWPIIQKFTVEETKHTTLDLEPQVIQLADDLVYEVECKVLYRIVDLRKAIIEIDDLVTGLKNRTVLAVQNAVGRRDRASIRDVEGMIEEIRERLRPMEEQWGVRILQFGFANISPSPTTLEITQLELLAREKRELYREFRADGLTDEAAVALVSGAVALVHPDEPQRTLTAQRREELALDRELEEGQPPDEEEDPLAEFDEDGELIDGEDDED